MGLELARSGRDARVPDLILNAPKEAQRAFVRAVTSSELKVNSQLSAQSFVLLLRSLGHACSIVPLPRSHGGWMLKLGDTQLPEHERRQVWGIWTTAFPEQRPRQQSLYDLTTNNHHFHAGVGGLVVHNTDSVMVDFGTKDIHECFKLGQEAADMVSATFKQPIELEFEKTFSPFLLFSKKRYAGLMFVEPDKPSKVDCKGIQLVRRDVSGIVKEVSKKALDYIMYDKDPVAAMEAIRDGLRRLYAGQVPIKDLVLSKSLRADYKTDLQPHVIVARKIKARNPGAEPRAGDRVPYLFIEDGSAGKSVSCRAEDPQYAEEEGLPVDSLYYANALCSAVSDIVSALGHDITEVSKGCGEMEYLPARKARDLRTKHASQNKAAGQAEITRFFK